MPRINDLTGKTYSRLTVLKRAENRNKRVRWLCLCSCGKETEVDATSITHGRVKSCGCLRDEVAANRLTTHGKSSDNEYRESQRLLKLYGITLEEKLSLHADQDGECAICNVPVESRKAHVDHCHNSGKVRGLLCSRCNKALGLFNDDPSVLLKASFYLQEY